MTKIIFYPNRGGLGDSIVGCSSCFILSKVLDLKFEIANGLLKIYNYFDIPQEYKCKKENSINYNYEPNEENDKLFMYSDLNIFKNCDIHLTSGSNFSRFIYKNSNFINKINIKETDVINYLFKNILIPKKQYLEKLNYYIDTYDITNIIGMQIRLGNKWNDGFTKNSLTEKTILNFINCLKYINKMDNISSDRILLITDNYKEVSSYLNKYNIKNIINIHGEITHSLKENNVDYEKTSIDMLLIGHTKHSIISYWSNFGRIGVLQNKTINIWLVEPEFENNIINKNRQWRDKNDPDVIEFRKGHLNELLSKESSFI